MTDDPVRPVADQKAVEVAEEASDRLNAARQRLELGDAAVTQWTIASLKAEADRLAAIAWPDQAAPATASTSIAALLPVAAQLVAEDKPARPPMLNPKVHTVDAEREIRRPFMIGKFSGELRKAAHERKARDPKEHTIYQVGDMMRFLADKAGKLAGNTYEMIAKRCGLHMDTVYRVVRYLRARGMLFVYNTMGHGCPDEPNRFVREANMYLLLIPSLEPSRESSPPPEPGAAVSILDPLTLLHRAWDYAAPFFGLPKQQDAWNRTPVRQARRTSSPA